MKNIISLFIVIIIIISGFGVSGLNNNHIKSELKNKITFSNLEIINKDEKLTLELEGTNSIFIRRDYYIIPFYINTYTFPYQTEIINVYCRPININRQIVEKDLMVAPNPTISNGKSIKNDYLTSINPNSIDEWFEYDIGMGINENERCIILKIQIFPIQYKPSLNIIEWAEDFEINIEYIESKITKISYDDEYKFIILTSSEFTDKLEELVNHKMSRGLSTKLVTLHEIYNNVYFLSEGRDNPERIKYFIKNCYDQWGTRNVLLVGGSDEFPTRETHVYVNYSEGDGEIFVSDLYYADLYNENLEFSSWDTNNNDLFGEYNWSGLFDDVDLYPDVNLGRLACVDSDEVTICVDKIIKYENDKAYTMDWFTNLLVIGGDTFPGDENSTDEGEFTNQVVMDIMDGFIPIKCWATEGTLNNNININKAFKNGVGFVDFSGHGNTRSWSTHPHENPDIWIPIGGFRNTDASSLVNHDKLPIIVTEACSVGKFNERADCLTWSFISNPNGGGIGSFGPAALGWAYDGEWCIRGLVGKMTVDLFRSYGEKRAITFGEMWVRAINNYISPNMDSGDYKTVEEWQPFGDPTLAIADESLPPEKPTTPEGISSGSTNQNYNYSTSAIDPDGDQIYYIFDWGDGSYSEWLGPYNSGVKIQDNHLWIEEGSYEIRVKAKDDHGVQSEWSDPLGVNMPKKKSFNFIPNILVWLFERFPFLQSYFYFFF